VVKYEKGKKIESGARVIETLVATRPVEVRKASKQQGNPWIAKRHFETVLARCTLAENMCKDLIRVIAVDDGEFLASHDFDYLQAGNAILKGDV
jgi:hypothetical protein